MGRSMSRSLKTHAINAIIVTAVFVLSYELVGNVIDPIQSLLLTTGYASVLFLPHGIRVLAVFLYGPVTASMYLLLATLVSLSLNDNPMDKSVLTSQCRR